MSGHSKWATTKHQKAVVDAKRGKLFAKLVKNIEVAARTGGADPDGNPTLFDAIQKARKTSVPLDNIERAVKRGSGAETGGADWETIMYEGYGPNGVAVLIECLTDNRNRAAMEVRTAMSRNNASMAAFLCLVVAHFEWPDITPPSCQPPAPTPRRADVREGRRSTRGGRRSRAGFPAEPRQSYRRPDRP